MGALIAVVVVALAALVALGAWRGRQVSIALAGAECPSCRIALVPLRAGDGRTWEVQACPRCDHLVTTVGHLPSPLAECPACHHNSLVVYAERVDGEVAVDEWCDLCGRRARTVLGHAPTEPPAPEGRVLPFRRR
ncbi:MAG: hypothetical protein ABMA64_36745 [Myxococcota bacterium]